MKAWLRFFRVVNLPTVPGDVLVGAAMLAVSGTAASLPFAALVTPLSAACLASVFLYLFGLADNDLVGASSDGRERPIPAGEISVRAARVARGLCALGALAAGALGNLPPAWWLGALALFGLEISYNRSKGCLAMGLCRGLDVLLGGAATLAACGRPSSAGGLSVLLASLVWTLYVAAVTRYSEGESMDPEKKRLVGLLIGGIVYLQLFALLAAYLLAPSELTRNLLLAGAGLLVVLRLMKRGLPGVSAS